MTTKGVLWIVGYAFWMVLTYVGGWFFGKKLGEVMVDMF